MRTVREAGIASRTGPPPAGMKAAVSPSPLDPVQRADPRKSHGTAPPVAGPERTHGRTATRPGARGDRPCTVRTGPYFRTDHNPANRNNAP